MAVLRATWQRGLPTTSPWKLENYRLYKSIGRTELGLFHIKIIFRLCNKLIKTENYFEEVNISILLKMYLLATEAVGD